MAACRPASLGRLYRRVAFESAVAGELGDEDDVVAGAHQAGQAGVAQGMRRQRDVGGAAEATDGQVDGPGGRRWPFSDSNSPGPSAPGSFSHPTWSQC